MLLDHHHAEYRRAECADLAMSEIDEAVGAEDEDEADGEQTVGHAAYQAKHDYGERHLQAVCWHYREGQGHHRRTPRAAAPSTNTDRRRSARPRRSAALPPNRMLPPSIK